MPPIHCSASDNRGDYRVGASEDERRRRFKIREMLKQGDFCAPRCTTNGTGPPCERVATEVCDNEKCTTMGSIAPGEACSLDAACKLANDQVSAAI